jgi:hypothetical protein
VGEGEWVPVVNVLETLFPALAKGNYRITSPRGKRYNCIAWAAGDISQWWWPGPQLHIEYWPPSVTRVVSLESFQAAFAALGYVVCTNADLEAGVEKIAIFADTNAEPTHAARQLPSGRWTSKLGVLEDIEHTLRDLEGTEYGTVSVVMKRPVGTLSRS